MLYAKSLVWFRRDLRDFDHAALYHALKYSQQVYCAFVFDTKILDTLTNKADRRVEFIWESVKVLKTALKNKAGDLIVLHGNACMEISRLATLLNVSAVYVNHDYEPLAIQRDTEVAQQLKLHNIQFHSFKDQVIFEKSEIITQTNKPYRIFTPYKNTALKQLNAFYLKPYPVDLYIKNLSKMTHSPLCSLESIGFKRTNLSKLNLPPGMLGGAAMFTDFITRIKHYKTNRDYPAIKGVSYLSTHLRFGTVSIRHLARTAFELAMVENNTGAETWLNELIWRDFYFQILFHHPKIADGATFKNEFSSLAFPNNNALFEAWCKGETGYPLIDAAMRQLNDTGFMHNRLRMIVASFLTKDLLVDWRWGERYFAEHLLDFDLSANNGGWQWAASTGCDAQPWFRIFNPITQSERFDPQGQFIRRYIPELAACNPKEIHAPWQIPASRQQEIAVNVGKTYPYPIVNHETQRQLALALYKTTIQ